MTNRLEKLKDQAIDFAMNNFGTDKDDEIIPKFLALMPNGNLNVYTTPWRSADDKVAITELLRIRFKKEGVVAYAHISEAWRKSYKSEEEVATLPTPRNSPDREEVIIISGQDTDDNRFSATIPILRDEHGTRSIGEIEHMKTGGEAKLRGRMVSLLSERTDG